MGVGRVGVRSGIDGGSCGGQILSPSALGQETEDRGDDDQDEDQTGDGDPDSKVSLGEADSRRVVSSGRLEEIFFKKGDKK